MRQNQRIIWRDVCNPSAAQDTGRQPIQAAAPAPGRNPLSPASAQYRALLAWMAWWPNVLGLSLVVRPDTILRWHRAGFRSYWRWKSRGRPGRHRVSPELRELIRRMSKENPLWAPRASMVNSYPDLGRTAFAMSLELVFALLQWDADTFGVRQGRAATTIRPAIWHNRHHPDPLRFASSIRPDIIFNKDRYCGRLPQRLGFVAHQIQHQSRLLASVAALVGCAPRAIAHFTK